MTGAPRLQPRIATRVEQTYLALLLLPHNALRLRLQPELASCRDALALSEDCDPEDIQARFEEHAERLVELLWDGPTELAALKARIKYLEARVAILDFCSPRIDCLVRGEAMDQKEGSNP